MTEIPEHLLKRAQAAREKAAAEAGASTEGEASGDSRIPAHLLERSKAAKAGGSVAVADKPTGVAVAAPAEEYSDGCWSRRAHAAFAHRR